MNTSSLRVHATVIFATAFAILTMHVEQVSDREWVATKETTPGLLEAAKTMMKAGRGEDILFRDYEGGSGAPVCARRFLSLAERGGDDDMFSSDFSDDELKVSHPSFGPKVDEQSSKLSFLFDNIATL